MNGFTIEQANDLNAQLKLRASKLLQIFIAMQKEARSLQLTNKTASLELIKHILDIDKELKQQLTDLDMLFNQINHHLEELEKMNITVNSISPPQFLLAYDETHDIQLVWEMATTEITHWCYKNQPEKTYTLDLLPSK